MPEHPLHAPVLSWFGRTARDLPWRRPDVGAWGVLVSEVMLQQTPVVRVEPAWRAWLARWPDPRALAGDAPGEAVRAWGRLGYPRRALRLHAAAQAIVQRHGGAVPSDLAELRALPGVGDYTAAAVAVFAFCQRRAVLDTNVRRVHARALGGTALAAPAVTAAEVRRAEGLLPDDPGVAATWSVAVMELGALVCTARTPRCGDCPVAGQCAWRLAGAPPYDGPRRRSQAWHGTDRQARGRLLAVLRESPGPVPPEVLRQAWTDDHVQRERALDGLVADGLVDPLADGRYALPSRRSRPSPPAGRRAARSSPPR